MLWLAREVAQTGVSGADKLVFALLEQLPGTYVILVRCISSMISSVMSATFKGCNFVVILFSMLLLLILWIFSLVSTDVRIK